jgi:hypothetical protein
METSNVGVGGCGVVDFDIGIWSCSAPLRRWRGSRGLISIYYASIGICRTIYLTHHRTYTIS